MLCVRVGVKLIAFPMTPKPTVYNSPQGEYSRERIGIETENLFRTDSDRLPETDKGTGGMCRQQSVLNT
jgi:hypothetical protein